MQTKTKQSGFTLIEILVVMGIIAVLAAIVLVAINPARQFAQARNTQRTSNVTAILDAAGQYLADNQGVVDGLNIPNDEIDTAFCEAIVDIYLPAMPTDPTSATEGADINCGDIDDGDVDYTVTEEDNGRITVCAPNAELENALGDDAEEICITR